MTIPWATQLIWGTDDRQQSDHTFLANVLRPSRGDQSRGEAFQAIQFGKSSPSNHTVQRISVPQEPTAKNQCSSWLASRHDLLVENVNCSGDSRLPSVEHLISLRPQINPLLKWELPSRSQACLLNAFYVTTCCSYGLTSSTTGRGTPSRDYLRQPDKRPRLTTNAIESTHRSRFHHAAPTMPQETRAAILQAEATGSLDRAAPREKAPWCNRLAHTPPSKPTVESYRVVASPCATHGRESSAPANDQVIKHDHLETSSLDAFRAGCVQHDWKATALCPGRVPKNNESCEFCWWPT